MTSLRQLGNQRVGWEIRGFLAREVVLTFGAEQVGAVHVTDAGGRTAVATCADGKWQFRVEDLGGSRISLAMVTAVDAQGRETLVPAGELALKRLLSGRLTMADGSAF